MRTKRSPNLTGFMLIEVIVTFALLGLLAGLALFASMRTYQENTIRVGIDSLVAQLIRARTQAMEGAGSGFCCAPSNSILFSPKSGTTTQTTFPISNGIATSSVGVNQEGTVEEL